jgi:hypothetical protein
MTAEVAFVLSFELRIGSAIAAFCLATRPAVNLKRHTRAFDA